MFILKFINQDCWIAPWEGDPGRALVKESAKVFKTKSQARKYAAKVINANSFRDFNLKVERK